MYSKKLHHEKHPDGSDSDGNLYVVDSGNAVGKLPSFKVMVAFETLKVQFYFDSCSSAKIFDGTTFQKLCNQLGTFNCQKAKASSKCMETCP